MVNQCVYLNDELLCQIKAEISRIGYNVSVAAWIKQACIEKIEGRNQEVEVIIYKLEQWQKSFPKRPFKEILREIQNGKI